MGPRRRPTLQGQSPKEHQAKTPDRTRKGAAKATREQHGAVVAREARILKHEPVNISSHPSNSFITLRIQPTTLRSLGFTSTGRKWTVPDSGRAGFISVSTGSVRSTINKTPATTHQHTTVIQRSPEAPQLPSQSSNINQHEHISGTIMAPVKDPNSVQSSIKDVVQNLFEVQTQVHGFVPETQQLLIDKMTDLAQSLAHLQKITSPTQSPNNPIHQTRIAPEIIDYVDDGRNPDIFTRDFVELVQRGNAVINGKQQAFRDFSQVFANALKEGIDGVGDEVDLVMKNVQGNSTPVHEQGARENGASRS